MSKKSTRNISIIAAVAVGLVAIPIAIRYTRSRRASRYSPVSGHLLTGDDYNDDINFDDGRRSLFNDYQSSPGRLRAQR